MSAIEVAGLVKTFGEVRALDGLDLDVDQGQVMGLLGPNGAGKTTAVRILATLLAPTSGTARVMGHDVVADPHAVRSMIGLTGQVASVDEDLTGRENLVLVGRLLSMPLRDVQQRADELLERFELADAGGRPTKTYSGGMRRRLDLAVSLVGRPPILFLDEPTTGLDPRSRLSLWGVIRELTADGVTLLLTTQYLEEADQLADEIAVIDHGRVIARGTADQLKDEVGGQVVEVRATRVADLDRIAALLAEVTGEDAVIDRSLRRVAAATAEGLAAVHRVSGRLSDAGLEVADLNLRRPSLDEVFLHVTGRHVVDEQEVPA